MPSCNQPGCRQTHKSPGGLINLAAYAKSSKIKWVCPDHLPSDWNGHPTGRLFPHELLAIHAYVAKNMETIIAASKTPKRETSE